MSNILTGFSDRFKKLSLRFLKTCPVVLSDILVHFFLFSLISGSIVVVSLNVMICDASVPSRTAKSVDQGHAQLIKSTSSSEVGKINNFLKLPINLNDNLREEKFFFFCPENKLGRKNYHSLQNCIKTLFKTHRHKNISQNIKNIKKHSSVNYRCLAKIIF